MKIGIIFATFVMAEGYGYDGAAKPSISLPTDIPTVLPTAIPTALPPVVAPSYVPAPPSVEAPSPHVSDENAKLPSGYGAPVAPIAAEAQSTETDAAKGGYGKTYSSASTLGHITVAAILSIVQ